MPNQDGASKQNGFNIMILPAELASGFSLWLNAEFPTHVYSVVPTVAVDLSEYFSENFDKTGRFITTGPFKMTRIAHGISPLEYLVNLDVYFFGVLGVANISNLQQEMAMIMKRALSTGGPFLTPAWKTDHPNDLFLCRSSSLLSGAENGFSEQAASEDIFAGGVRFEFFGSF